MLEVKCHTFPDKTVIAIFEDKAKGIYTVGLFDKTDIMIWEQEFDDEGEAWTEYNKRVEQGPIDQRKDNG
jgi:hypothetical protein